VTALQADMLGTVYGVVRFEPGPDRMVRDAVITFESAQAADLFAVEQGWHDYAVCALCFFADQLPVPRNPLTVASGAGIRGGRA
jgi:hypothetical protein